MLINTAKYGSTALVSSGQMLRLNMLKQKQKRSITGDAVDEIQVHNPGHILKQNQPCTSQLSPMHSPHKSLYSHTITRIYPAA